MGIRSTEKTGACFAYGWLARWEMAEVSSVGVGTMGH